MMAPAKAIDHSERVLVARLVVGADAVLAEIYDEHSAMVQGAASRVLADSVAAEDVCQEVFVQLWAQASVIDLASVARSRQRPSPTGVRHRHDQREDR